jgi:hypothetical protein
MLFIVILLLINSYVPTASVDLKGIGIGCFPFYLDYETAVFTYPTLLRIDDSEFIAINRLYTKPDWAVQEWRNYIRCAFHFPRWSAIAIEGFSYRDYDDEHTEIKWTHSLGLNRFGFMYTLGYRNLPTIYEHKQILISGKLNYTSPHNRLLANCGLSYGRIQTIYDEINWILGPILEIRYNFHSIVIYATSRHPEDFVEMDALELFHSYVAMFDYYYFPFEAGVAFVKEYDNGNVIVFGLKTNHWFVRRVESDYTFNLSAHHYMFVAGLNYGLTRNIFIRGGLELDYYSGINRLREMRYSPSMGGSIKIGDNFKLDIATKNLATPLDYDVAVKWIF